MAESQDMLSLPSAGPARGDTFTKDLHKDSTYVVEGDTDDAHSDDASPRTPRTPREPTVAEETAAQLQASDAEHDEPVTDDLNDTRDNPTQQVESDRNEEANNTQANGQQDNVDEPENGVVDQTALDAEQDNNAPAAGDSGHDTTETGDTQTDNGARLDGDNKNPGDDDEQVGDVEQVNGDTNQEDVDKNGDSNIAERDHEQNPDPDTTDKITENASDPPENVGDVAVDDATDSKPVDSKDDDTIDQDEDVRKIPEQTGEVNDDRLQPEQNPPNPENEAEQELSQNENGNGEPTDSTPHDMSGDIDVNAEEVNDNKEPREGIEQAKVNDAEVHSESDSKSVHDAANNQDKAREDNDIQTESIEMSNLNDNEEQYPDSQNEAPDYTDGEKTLDDQIKLQKQSDQVDSRNENGGTGPEDLELKDDEHEQSKNSEEQNTHSSVKNSQVTKQPSDVHSNPESSPSTSRAYHHQPASENPVIIVQKADTDESLGKSSIKSDESRIIEKHAINTDEEPDVGKRMARHEDKVDQRRQDAVRHKRETDTADDMQEDEQQQVNATTESNVKEARPEPNTTTTAEPPSRTSDRTDQDIEVTAVHLAENQDSSTDDSSISSISSPQPKSKHKKKQKHKPHSPPPDTSRSDHALESMHNQAHNILEAVHTIQKENNSMREENERLRAEKASLENEIKKLKRHFKKMENELNNRIAELEGDLNAALDRIRDFENLVMGNKSSQDNRRETRKRHHHHHHRRHRQRAAVPDSSSYSSTTTPEVHPHHQPPAHAHPHHQPPAHAHTPAPAGDSQDQVSSAAQELGAATSASSVEECLRADVKRLESYSTTIEQSLKSEIEKRQMLQQLLDEVMATNEAFKAQFDKWRESIRNHETLKKEHSELEKKYKALMTSNMDMNVALLELQPSENKLPELKDKYGSRGEVLDRIEAAELELRESKRRVGALEDYLQGLYNGDVRITLKAQESDGGTTLPDIGNKKKRVVNANGPYTTYAAIARKRQMKRFNIS